jgi:alcohol dehydrogenase
LKRVFTFRTAGEILFGKGAIEEIGQKAREFGASKILVVIDPGFMENGGLEKIKKPLLREGLEAVFFEEVEPEPGVETADNCSEYARKNRCDLVIGVGGGSAMDVAKAVAILLTNGGKASDYQGVDKVSRPGVPKIMVPTTAGTGSEVTLTAVFTKKDERVKAGINSPYLFAELALLDPTLTIFLPPIITAATGMDALTHAIEAYTSKNAGTLAETLSLKAIELISQNLRAAVTNGENLEARTDMLMGSLLGGMALANAGVGAAHSLAYPLGGIHNISHGVANGLLLPWVMEFNLISNPKKFAIIAGKMGEQTEGASEKKAAESSVEAVKRLLFDIGATRSLRELGITEKDISELAEGAMKVTRQVSREDAIKLYQKALD